MHRNILVITDNLQLFNEFKEIVSGLKLKSIHFDYACSPFNQDFEAIKGFVFSVDVKTKWFSLSKTYDLIISLHCKQRFPSSLVQKVKCINIHPGLNPYNRGWYPHVFSIVNKLPLGATIHEIDEDIDHGAIIAQQEVPLYSWDTSLTAYDRVVEAELSLIKENLNRLVLGEYESTPMQQKGNINFRQDFNALCEIDLSEVATFGEVIDRLRALTHSDYKNAYFIDKTGTKVFVSIDLEIEGKTDAFAQVKMHPKMKKHENAISPKLKPDIKHLVIFGGEPAFKHPLHVGKPNIGNRGELFKRFNSVLNNDWLTNFGPYVREFESRISKMLGVKHCISMCNGTVALEIAVRALGMTGEVIVPSFTFVATAHCLQWQEITPIFCDVDPATHNIDPATIERLITSKTTGIIGVHLWGRPCNIDELQRIASKHNLHLLYDASHAFGCTVGGDSVARVGDASIFSFHATKFVNSAEGGAVVTNNDDLAQKIRLMKNFGFAGYDNVIHLGTNGKMNEFSAAMGLTSLESMDTFIDVNRRNYNAYLKALRDVPGISMITYEECEENNYQYIVLEIDKTEIGGLSRDQIMMILHAENVLVRRYFFPGCHRMEPYRSYYPNSWRLLPETERLVDRVLCLPTGTAVHTVDIEKICEIIKFVVSNASSIKKKLTKADTISK